MPHEKTHCTSQQTPGKSCREDTWLQHQPDLWCAHCAAESELERMLEAWALLGYV